MSDSASGCSSFGEPTSPPSTPSDSARSAVGIESSPKTGSSTSDSTDCNVSDSESQSPILPLHSDHIRQGESHQQLTMNKPRHSIANVRKMRNVRKRRKRLQTEKKSKCCAKWKIANLKQELLQEQM